MFLNDDGPIAAGRELWGFPKKLARPSLRTEIDTLVGTLDYGPLRVATGTMGYKHHEADLAQVKALLGMPNFMLKIIPHVDGSPRICELAEYHLEHVLLRGTWTGPAALSLTPHALAPVAELPVLEVVSAIHIVAELTLGHGKVAHDYLREPSQQALQQGKEPDTLNDCTRNVQQLPATAPHPHPLCPLRPLLHVRDLYRRRRNLALISPEPSDTKRSLASSTAARSDGPTASFFAR